MLSSVVASKTNLLRQSSEYRGFVSSFQIVALSNSARKLWLDNVRNANLVNCTLKRVAGDERAVNEKKVNQ